MSRFSRRHFFLLSGAAPLAAKKKQPKGLLLATIEPPNILLIVADNLAAWMCGCYGNREIRTPNIDLLARLGLRFRDAFVVTPAAAPSRATLFTGRTPMQHGVKDAPETGADGKEQTIVPASFARELLLSDLLSKAGYHCGYIGQWGLGDNAKPAHGFDYTYTLAGDSTVYRNPAMYRNGEQVKEQGYLAELMTGAACDFLDKQTPEERFFLTLSYPNPREPYEEHPQKYYDLYKDTSFDTLGWLPAAANAAEGKKYLEDAVANIRKCAAATTALDDQIKVLFDKLRARKIWNNTLVIFTSDSGHLLGRHGLWGGGTASDPINMYDEVMQVPMIMSWPGRIPVEATRPDLFSFYDLVPTLSALTHVSVPPERKLCGSNFVWPLLGKPFPKEEALWHRTIFGSYRNTAMARTNRFKLIIRNRGEGPNELYDLRRDPQERRNEYGNDAYLTVRNSLSAELDRWSTRYSA